jgi:hypothetical protein
MQEISGKTGGKQSSHSDFFLGLFFGPEHGGDMTVLNVG